MQYLSETEILWVNVVFKCVSKYCTKTVFVLHCFFFNSIYIYTMPILLTVYGQFRLNLI